MPEKTFEFELIKSRETFQFKPPIPIEGFCTTGLTSLEVNNSIFIITQENNKFELYTDSFGEFHFEELKDELEEFLKISDITAAHVQHEKIGPHNIEAYGKLRLEKSSTDGYIILLKGYARSPFRDFESYHRLVVGLDEDDIQMISKQYTSFCITYELSPGIFIFKDISEAIYTFDDHEGTLQNEYDDIGMKTKLILTRFGSTFGTFDQN